LLWCGRCGRRLIITPARSKTGVRYFYYICRGRQDRSCDLPAMPVGTLEDKVLDHYATVPIPANLREKIRRRLDEAVTANNQVNRELVRGMKLQLCELDEKEDRLLDLLGDPDWPQEKIRTRLRDIRRQQAQLRRQLEQPEQSVDRGRLILLQTLELLERPQELYRLAHPEGRQLLNRAVFNKLLVNQEAERSFIAADELNEPFQTVVEYHRRRSARHERAEAPYLATLRMVPSQLPLVDVLDAALDKRGLSKAKMVDLLRAYSNFLPEVEKPLEALFQLQNRPESGVDLTLVSPPRKLRKRPPRSIIAQMILDYQAGLSMRDLAAKYELPKTGVLNILHAEGVARPRERITEQQIRQATRLIHRGDTINKAAAKLGVSNSTLRYQLKRRGLPTRASQRRAR
jgi:AraC-like DNA-binding protein